MAKGKGKKGAYPEKRTMNLYFKPDRTTVPATIMLYVLFAVTLCIGFFKWFIYDIMADVADKEAQLARAAAEKESYEAMLTDYDEVLHQYQIYSATQEELSQTNRMEILGLLDEVIRPHAGIESISVSDGYVKVSFSGVTLRETAELVRELEESPIVASTVVNTANTEEGKLSGQEGAQTPVSGTEEDRGSLVKATIQITLSKEQEGGGQP